MTVKNCLQYHRVLSVLAVCGGKAQSHILEALARGRELAIVVY
jgi:hypothetical protein